VAEREQKLRELEEERARLESRINELSQEIKTLQELLKSLGRLGELLSQLQAVQPMRASQVEHRPPERPPSEPQEIPREGSIYAGSKEIARYEIKDRVLIVTPRRGVRVLLSSDTAGFLKTSLRILQQRNPRLQFSVSYNDRTEEFRGLEVSGWSSDEELNDVMNLIRVVLGEAVPVP